MGVRKVLAAISIVAMVVTGVSVAIFLFTHRNTMSATPSSGRASLTPPPPKVPTPQEFKVGVEVTGQQCGDAGICTYTYSIQPSYVGFHPLPEQDFTVFYQVVGGAAPQPGTFTVSGGQARVLKDVTLEGPPDAQLQATVTKISPVAGPKPVPSPNVAPELSPQPINSPDRQPAAP